MKDFKELYERAIEATFSGEIHKMLYDGELTNEPLSVENVEAFRNLFQRYKNLRNFGNAEFVEVGMRDRMDAINKCGTSNDGDKCDVGQKDSEETIEQINADRQMNIIGKAIAMMTKPDYGDINTINLDKCRISNVGEKQDEKSVPNPMIFYMNNRDRAIEFIDKLKKIINAVGYVTVYQACVLLTRLENDSYWVWNQNDVNNYLLGWTDLSSIIDADGSYDRSIVESNRYYGSVTVLLPAPKCLTNDFKEEN